VTHNCRQCDECLSWIPKYSESCVYCTGRGEYREGGGFGRNSTIEKKNHEGKEMRYNHAFDIAFEVKTDNEGGAVTADELRRGLRNRLNGMSDDEIIEACGLPFDTYEEVDLAGGVEHLPTSEDTTGMSNSNERMKLGDVEVSRNAVAFSDACFNLNTADDLAHARAYGPEESECRAWGISQEEWAVAVDHALHLLRG